MDFAQTGGLSGSGVKPGPGSVEAEKAKLVNEAMVLDAKLASLPVEMIQRHPWAAVGLAVGIGFLVSSSPRVTALLSDASSSLLEQYMRQIKP